MYTGPRGNNSTWRAQRHGQSRCQKQREKEAEEKRSQSDVSAAEACDGLQTNSTTGAAFLRTDKTIRFGVSPRLKGGTLLSPYPGVTLRCTSLPLGIVRRAHDAHALGRAASIPKG